MLASLRLPALLAGVGSGTLASALLAVAVGGVLTAAGVPDGAVVALAPSIVVGIGIGGYVAGRFATLSSRFNGSVTGLLVAAVVVGIARLGGSPAPTPEVILLAAIGITAGGVGGQFAARRVARNGGDA